MAKSKTMSDVISSQAQGSTDRSDGTPLCWRIEIVDWADESVDPCVDTVTDGEWVAIT